MAEPVDDIAGRVNTLLDRITVISDSLQAIAGQTQGVVGDLSANLDAISVEGSGLLSLRIGQRVRFDLVEESGRRVARNLQIVTL